MVIDTDTVLGVVVCLNLKEPIELYVIGDVETERRESGGVVIDYGLGGCGSGGLLGNDIVDIEHIGSLRGRSCVCGIGDIDAEVRDLLCLHRSRGSRGEVEAADGPIAPPSVVYLNVTCGGRCGTGRAGVGARFALPGIRAVLVALVNDNDRAVREVFLGQKYGGNEVRDVGCRAVGRADKMNTLGGIIVGMKLTGPVEERVISHILAENGENVLIGLDLDHSGGLRGGDLGHLKGLRKRALYRLADRGDVGSESCRMCGGKPIDLVNVAAGEICKPSECNGVSSVVVAHVVAVTGDGVADIGGAEILNGSTRGDRADDAFLYLYLGVVRLEDRLIHLGLVTSVGREGGMGAVLLICPGQMPVNVRVRLVLCEEFKNLGEGGV